MNKKILSVPDTHGSNSVEVTNITVSVGDILETNDVVIELETDKIVLEIEGSIGAKVADIKVNVGDKVSEGDDLIELDMSAVPVLNPMDTESFSRDRDDVGVIGLSKLHDSDAHITKFCVNYGDDVKDGDILIELETDKIVIEVPAPVSGKVVSIMSQLGDLVRTDAELMILRPVNLEKERRETEEKTQKAREDAAALAAQRAETEFFNQVLDSGIQQSSK